jgi:hypothetical protein
VVHVRVVVANNLHSVQDVGHEAVSLRDHILCSRDVLAQTTRPDDSAGEEALVVLVGLANSLVHVDVAVLREDRLDVELRQTAELKLEGKSRLAVADAGVFSVGRSTESEVARVGAILVTADECQTAHAAGKELLLVVLHDGCKTGQDLLVVKALSVADGNVADSRELVIALRLSNVRRSTLGEVS